MSLVAFPMMLAAIAVLLCGTHAQSPSREWTINSNNTLIWSGRPYMPVGVRVSGDPEEIKRALDAGIRDLVIELPANGAGWDAAISLTEAAGARWFLAVSSAATGALGTIVEPGGLRVDLEGKTTIEATVSGATSALCLVADKRTAGIRSFKEVNAKQGALVYDVSVGDQTGSVLLLYPQTRDLSLTDFWEGFDSRRDELLASLSTHKLGAGLRGVIDPLGRQAKFPTPDMRFVPRSPIFNLELAEHLEDKYGTVSTCLKAWSVGTNDVKEWSQLARLVPLWSTSKGVEWLWDPVSERTYASNRKYSSVWDDIRHVMRVTSVRRVKRLVESIEDVAGVPVIQTWTGWSGPYDLPDSNVSGVAFQSEAPTAEGLIESACMPASSILQSSRGRLLLSSGARVTDESSIDAAVLNLRSLGVRAYFFDTDDESLLNYIAKVAPGVMSDTGDAEWKPPTLFFPEGARDPAYAKQISGGRWMLPSPNAGGRLEIGRALSGYSINAPEGLTTVLWSNVGRAKERLFTTNPGTMEVLTADGAPIKSKVNKNSVEIEVGENPILVRGLADIPVPQSAYDETLVMLGALFGTYGKTVDPGGEQAMIFAQNTKAYERNPYGGYSALRKQFDLIVQRAAPYVWMEAERTTQTNLGDVTSLPGASGGACLLMDSRLSSGIEYFASYRVRPRSRGKYEFWVAAAIPSYATEHLHLTANGKEMVPSETMVSPYGKGFAWYKFDQTELFGECDVKVSLAGGALASVALDVIVASPVPFVPTGSRPPIDFIVVPTK